MKTFERFVHALAWRTAQVAQFVLAFVMLLIVANVIVRIWWKPIPGTYELVEMSGAILLAMAVAYTAVMKGHISVGVLVDSLPVRVQAAMDIVVNSIALFFSYLLARETFIFAARMMERGYTTGHLLLPIAPSIYLVGLGITMLSLVLLKDVLKAVMVVLKEREAQ